MLVYRTPYGRSAGGATELVRAAVGRGYAVVLQDVRGRYGSAGEFEPYRHEGKDGYDTIEWAARQPWSTGAVGSFGLSYPGAVQWLAAVERPPSLKAMVPAMTYSDPESFWYSGGVWDGSWLDWTWLNIAPDLRRRLRVPGPQTGEAADTTWQRDGPAARKHRPLQTLADFKDIAPWYYEWMRHPPRDPWWRWAALDGKYAGVTAAVLNLSGWFDEPYGPGGAVANHLGLAEARSPDSLRSRLILGPWTHGGQESRQAGDRDFGASAAIDYTATVLDWMDRYVKGRCPRRQAGARGSRVRDGCQSVALGGPMAIPGHPTGHAVSPGIREPGESRSPPPSPGHGSAATECYRVRPSRHRWRIHSRAGTVRTTTARCQGASSSRCSRRRLSPPRVKS